MISAVSKTFRRRRIDILAGGTKQGELANHTKNNDNRIIFWETSKFALNLQIVGYIGINGLWHVQLVEGIRGWGGSVVHPKFAPGINGAVSKVPCYL